MNNTKVSKVADFHPHPCRTGVPPVIERHPLAGETPALHSACPKAIRFWNKTTLSLAILGTMAIQPLSVFADDKTSAPASTCSAPWYAGMAYACGWMKAALHSLDANG